MRKLPSINDITIGDHLYSTCGDCIFGTIANINQSVMTIDMIVYDGYQCLILNDNDYDDFDPSPLRTLRNVPLLACDIKIYDIFYSDYNSEYILDIHTDPPWFGCERCVKAFKLIHSTGNDISETNTKCWILGDPLPQDYTKYLILK